VSSHGRKDADVVLSLSCGRFALPNKGKGRTIRGKVFLDRDLGIKLRKTNSACRERRGKSPDHSRKGTKVRKGFSSCKSPESTCGNSQYSLLHPEKGGVIQFFRGGSSRGKIGRAIRLGGKPVGKRGKENLSEKAQQVGSWVKGEKGKKNQVSRLKRGGKGKRH